MKKLKFIFYFLIFAMLIGGIMGIIKGLIPNMIWFSFRYLLGMGGTFEKNNIPTYVIIYGITMAVLEIISAVLLLIKNRTAIKFAIATLSINAFGCIIAILLGDIFGIGSLIIRVLGIYILIRVRMIIPGYK